MNQRPPPELDMTLEGEFVSPPKPPVTSRILLWAIIIAVIAGGVSLAAFALWLALLILPVALGAAAIAWAMFQYRMWRAQKSFGSQRNVWRP
jgi:membrane protein implicated in regulation of membrane protease activity